MPFFIINILWHVYVYLILFPGNRFVSYKKIQLGKPENVRDISLEEVNRSPINKRYSLLNHLRGARFPFVWTSPVTNYVPIAPGFFPALNYRRYNMLMKKHKHYKTQPQPQRNLLSVPTKRKSAITPPSRDWCRLIGYRVCPRATKF